MARRFIADIFGETYSLRLKTEAFLNTVAKLGFVGGGYTDVVILEDVYF